MSERLARVGLIGILTAFVLLASAYAYVTPTLEAPDEIYHYDYIRSLVNTGRPPVLELGGGRGFGHHAPLYYVYGALFSFWVGENDLEVWPARHNPFFGYRFGEVGRDNKNLYLHPDDDAFGQSDTWLGIRVVRWASVLLGAITVWVVYRVGREVFPDRPEMALGAAGLTAFIPQFLFISGAVNDDNGAALFGALALWAMVRILGQGPTWRRCAGLGLALGLGWLSKLTIVALAPTAGVVVVWVARRSRSWRDLFRWGLAVFGVAALLIVPWLVRQTVLYGDPTGTAREMSEWGLPEQPVTLANLGPDLYWLRTSFWGRLAYNQIPLSDWIYNVLDVATLLAILGLVRHTVGTRGRGDKETRRQKATPLVSLSPCLPISRSPCPKYFSQITILATAFVFTLGPMVVRRFLRPMPSFGRYLFPVLPSIALLMFTGLAAWLPRRHHLHLALGLTAGMLALGIAGLLGYLAPAYARPPVYEVSDAPDPAHRLDWIYLEDDRPLARLHGYGLERGVVEPGEMVQVTLYWEALEDTAMDYALFAQAFGRGGAKVGQRDTYPGLGHYPTSFWRPGQVIADTVPISIAENAAAPSRLRLDVGLYERVSGRRLAVVDEAGNPVGAATMGWLKLVAAEKLPPPPMPTDYRLGDVIALAGYDLEQDADGIRLTLYWTCLAAMEQDYTVFVHLLDPAGTLAAQADGPPVGGDYSTSLWSPDEMIADERFVSTENLSAGTYSLRVGMYLLETGKRLPALDGQGVRLPADVIPLTEVAVGTAP
jgi:hypothetical protein